MTKKTDSQNYYLFVCPHKPIIQYFSVLASWDFSFLPFLSAGRCSGVSPFLLSRGKPVSFSSGESGGGFAAGLLRVGGKRDRTWL